MARPRKGCDANKDRHEDFERKPRGAILGEYALLSSLLAVILILTLSQFGGQIRSLLQSSADAMTEAFERAPPPS